MLKNSCAIFMLAGLPGDEFPGCMPPAFSGRKPFPVRGWEEARREDYLQKSVIVTRKMYPTTLDSLHSGSRDGKRI
jgi:hypothetical protein